MKKLIPILTLLAVFSSPVLGNDSPEALQNAFVQGMEANDADALAACYTEDAVSFAVDVMFGTGRDFVRNSWNSFFETYTVKKLSLSNTHMESVGDAAVAWGLFTMLVEPTGGGELIEMQGRFMDVAKKVDGNWLYVADHASMPLPAGE